MKHRSRFPAIRSRIGTCTNSHKKKILSVSPSPHTYYLSKNYNDVPRLITISGRVGVELMESTGIINACPLTSLLPTFSTP